jgi:hypothetical protein
MNDLQKSKRFSLNDYDWASFGKAVFKYTAPLILLFLVEIQARVPLKDALWTIYGAGLQLAINLLTKYVSGPETPKV